MAGGGEGKGEEGRGGKRGGGTVRIAREGSFTHWHLSYINYR